MQQIQFDETALLFVHLLVKPESSSLRMESLFTAVRNMFWKFKFILCVTPKLILTSVLYCSLNHPYCMSLDNIPNRVTLETKVDLFTLWLLWQTAFLASFGSN